MYLFTRQLLVSPGHIRAGMAHALDMLKYINEKTQIDASLFQVLQGAPLGTLTFAFRTESYAASVEANDGLVQSDEYLGKVEAGAAYYVGNPQDQLGEILHVAGEVSGPPAVASVISANLEVARASAAVAWSVDLANYTQNVTGQTTAVVSSNFGQYGRISWIGYGSSLADIESAGKKINTDPGFLQRLADSEGMFVSGSGAGVLSRKIA